MNKRPSTRSSSEAPCLSLIAALARNRVIGRENDLPWRLPEDMRHFMRTTLGKPVIMGRNTYDSMGEPLPGRTNIVVSGRMAPLPGVYIAKTLDDALQRAQCQCVSDDADEYFVIGGARLYAASLPLAQRLYLTWVHAEVAGDTFFPQFDLSDWRELRREDSAPPADDRPYAFSIVVYERA